MFERYFQQVFIRLERAKIRVALVNLFFRFMVKRSNDFPLDVTRIRRQQAKIDAMLARNSPHIESVPVSLGELSACWLQLRGVAASRTVLYFHGGAFITSMPNAHANMLGHWCDRLNARVLMVDYRLAPEHPWPAAVDDCQRAWEWMLAQGVDPKQVIFGGDSAGGNLALATLQRIKAMKLPVPACAVMLSPFVDFTLSGNSVVANANKDPMFSLRTVVALRSCYIAPDNYLHPTASPLFGDFNAMPPLLFQVGSTEVFLDDSVRSAQKAAAAGVEVKLEIWEQMPHVFQVLPFLPQSSDAMDHIAEFVSKHVASIDE